MIEERRAKIVETVNRLGTASFSTLMEMFPEVSEMTLRKDLKSLDGERRLVRIHGGARSLDTIYGSDMSLEQRLGQNIEKKQQIATKASALIEENAAIFLDSGSTMVALARCFPDIPCTIFTGGLCCANELSHLRQAEIYMFGGRLNKASLSVRDSRLTHDMENIYFDIAFIAVNGFSTENGFGCNSADRWEMEQTVIRRCARTVVLMDSTKVGKIRTFSICMPEQIDTLVSDDGLSEETRTYLEQRGVEVL